MNLKERIWEQSKPAQDFPKDWLVIPALDVIEMIEENSK